MRVKRVCGGAWTILAACNDRGDCDLQDFLQALGQRHKKDVARLMALFDRIASDPRGPLLLSDEISHSLGGNVWEFRQGGLRVLWFYGPERKVVVCSHGLVKKSKKVPKGDIALAQRRYTEAATEAVEIEEDDEEAEEL